MSIDTKINSLFNKRTLTLLAGLTAAALFFPTTNESRAESPDSTAALATSSEQRTSDHFYQVTMPDGKTVTSNDFRYDLYDFDSEDEAIIQTYLQKEKGLEIVKRYNGKERSEQCTKTIQEWLVQGIIPEIKYGLSYNNSAGNFFSFMGSSIKVRIFSDLQPGMEDELIINTMGPDYKFQKIFDNGNPHLKEDLNGKKGVFTVTDTGFVDLASGRLLEERIDFDALSRILSCYTNFSTSLADKKLVIMPMFTGGRTSDVTLYINRINDRWYSIFTRFDHPQKTGLTDEQMKEEEKKTKIDRVDVLVYNPPHTSFGLVYKLQINTTKGDEMYGELSK
jgi:hypothetical protein